MLSGGLRWPSEVKRCWLIAETPIDAVALLIRDRWRGVATRGAGLVRRRQKSPRERAARWEFAGAKRGLRVIPRGIYNTRVEFLREFCGF